MGRKELITFFTALLVILISIPLIRLKEKPKRPIQEHVIPLKQKGVPKADGRYRVAVDETLPILVGIMGQSATDDEPFDSSILVQLLTTLKEQDVQAIFFTGDFVSNPGTRNSDDKIEYEDQVANFSGVVTSILGNDFPFFPGFGEIESGQPTLQTFKKYFHLDNGITIDSNAMVYGVSIGKAFFAVIPTHFDHLDGKVKTAVLSWLDETLTEEKKKHPFLFVVGHNPVFPVSPLFLQNQKKIKQDTELWKILTKHKVLAYFASQNHLFDRSNHNGIWQILSGGSANVADEGADQSFIHSILLIIEPNGDTFPEIKVLDKSGKTVDEFELKPEKDSLIYQFHIS